jgi:uncharacterized protein (DUF1810 family)
MPAALDRFRKAQESSLAGVGTALAELRSGHKRSHWIWYIFPQLTVLGRSSIARHYGLRDVEEAIDYLSDGQLAARLIEVTEAVRQQLRRGVSLPELMGSEIDVIKLVSSLTLFEAIASRVPPADAGAHPLLPLAAEVLAEAERQGYARCGYTLSHVGQAPAPTP